MLGFLHLDAEWIPQNLAGLPVRARSMTGLRVVGSRGLAWVSSGETGDLAVHPWWSPQLGSFSRVGACQRPCGAPANSITGRIWENRLGDKATSESQPTDPDGAGISALSPVHADSGERRLCPSPQRARYTGRGPCSIHPARSAAPSLHCCLQKVPLGSWRCV